MIFGIPIEILDEVVSSLAKSDALNLSVTCRAAYACAVPSIIREISLGGTSIKDAERLQSFCNYMSADLPRRASYIRTLTLGAFIAPFLSAKDMRLNLGDRLADGIVRVISHATNLRELTILGAEQLFSEAPPQIAAALTSLDKLSKLCFEEYVGPHALKVLSEMRSQPSAVRLTSCDIQNCKPMPERSLLCNFSASLVSLTLINNHGLLQTREAGTAFPRVEHLVLGGVQDVADLPSMARTFPGVRTLEVYTRCTENRVGDGLWTSLDTVSLDRPIPLSRPVRQVELVGAEWLTEQLGLAVEMLETIKPMVLICPDVELEKMTLLARCASRGHVRELVRLTHTQGAVRLGLHD